MSEIGESLLRGAEEALSYAKGIDATEKTHKVSIPKNLDVLEIRHHLKMTRKAFSDEFGFSLRTLEKWERGERRPKGPARAYLVVIFMNPNAVRSALQHANVQ